MPYNAGYNAPTGMYGGYGFGNRLQGSGRINNVWGYDDNSNPLNSNQQYNQYQQSQQQPAYGSPQAGNPMDFFSRMAGMAGGMSPQGSPAGNRFSPDALASWNATHSYNANPNPTRSQFSSSVPQMDPFNVANLRTTGPEDVTRGVGNWMSGLRNSASNRYGGGMSRGYGGFR